MSQINNIVRSVQIEGIKSKFGIEDFLPGQEAAIHAILDGDNDVLIKMPTGGGKSLCFQGPAMATRNKVMLITSPLISLMGDQLDSLHTRGISATTINSSLSERERQERISRLKSGEYRMLYVAPETLLTQAFQNEVYGVPFNRMVADEAQCISTWGNGFRPDYLRLGVAAKKLEIDQKIACSATIDADVEADIIRYLGMNKKALEIISVPSFRPNLDFSVEKFTAKNQEQARFLKYKRVKELLATREVGATIIYCRTVPEAEELYFRLSGRGVKGLFLYHAQMSAYERQHSFDNFKSLKSPIVVATGAFGMGVDRPDVRLVIQHGEPYGLFDYIQAGGRAGRDGLPARVIAMYRTGRFSRGTEFQSRVTLPSLQYVESMYSQLKKFQQSGKTQDISVFRKWKIRMIESEYDEDDMQRQIFIQMMDDAILLLRRAQLLVDTANGYVLNALVLGSERHQKIIEHTQMIEEAEHKNTQAMYEYFNSENPDQKRLLELAGLS